MDNNCIPAHFPSHPVAFAVVVAQVSHFRADDVHSCLSHIILGGAFTRVVRVGDNLRHRADVTSTVVLIGVDAVIQGVPPEYLLYGHG